jgi:hypothetical protein
MPDVFVAGHKGLEQYPLHARVQEHPDAWIDKGTHYFTLNARICGECCHTEFWTKNPAKLYEHYLKSVEDK